MPERGEMQILYCKNCKTETQQVYAKNFTGHFVWKCLKCHHEVTV